MTRAQELLTLAAAETERVQRHLLVAAALGEVLAHVPIVVGGTAEEFWTQDEYHATDLDLCAPLSKEDELALAHLGFRREGRHFINDEVDTVVVEFPDSTIDGDAGRVKDVKVGSGRARVIGLDDLYLDRLRQATISRSENTVEFHSALAVATARYSDLDRIYIRQRVDSILDAEPMIGREMRRIDRVITRRVRDALS